MDSQTLQQRIRLGEDSTLELKQIVFRGAQKVIEPHPDGLSDELVELPYAAGVFGEKIEWLFALQTTFAPVV